MRYILAVTALFCVLFAGCTNPDEIRNYEMEQQQSLDQMRIEDLQTDLNTIRDDLDRTHYLQEMLVDDMQFLFSLTVSLHDRQELRLDEAERQMLAVHECAQVQEFVVRARELCDQGVSEHYCRVQEDFDRHCLPSEDGRDLTLPDEPGINSIFWRSTRTVEESDQRARDSLR